MIQQDIDKIKSILLNMQDELESLNSTSQSSTATVVLDQNSVGRLSRMDALQGQQMALETQRRRQLQLTQVKAALMRIENNDYGYCAVCDEEIIIGRLLINPIATRCINCSK